MRSMSPPTSATSTGGFTRHQGTFTGRITRDGSSGFLAEPGRYQLYASLACPWSQRVLIVRRLLGLEQVIGLSLTDPIRDERGWRVPDPQGGTGPVQRARLPSRLLPGPHPRSSEPCHPAVPRGHQNPAILSH